MCAARVIGKYLLIWKEVGTGQQAQIGDSTRKDGRTTCAHQHIYGFCQQKHREHTPTTVQQTSARKQENSPKINSVWCLEHSTASEFTEIVGTLCQVEEGVEHVVQDEHHDADPHVSASRVPVCEEAGVAVGAGALQTHRMFAPSAWVRSHLKDTRAGRRRGRQRRLVCGVCAC